MPSFKNIIGERFGRLVAVEYMGRSRWRCCCDCSAVVVVRKDQLCSGKTRSCGCLLSESTTLRFTKHSGSGSPTYKIWAAMIGRCENPNNASFHLYGGRGVTICDRWRESFADFLSDMGQRPSNRHSIDRIDPNGDYRLGNCRWATTTEQARNRRDSNNLTVFCVTKNICDWCEQFSINVSTVRKRLRNGQSAEEALTRPIFHRIKSEVSM